jgi:hypothetical protein
MSLLTSTLKKCFNINNALLFSLSLFVSLAGAQEKANKGNQKTFNVMAPLDLKTPDQWQQFDDYLKVAKSMGIDGVSVDIWWGKVEAKGDQVFEWQYYDRILSHLNRHQLEWIPIMSFHQCGGNVGDDCDIPIPLWIWDSIEGASAKDLKFKSEQGNYSSETLSFWQTSEVKTKIYQQYREFMQAFQSKYAEHADKIQELNISMGPAGELRYPSYNSHDIGSGYPTRGAIQGFNKLAINDFHAFLYEKYEQIETLNDSWNSTYTNFEQINISIDFEKIFVDKAHHKTGKARDYLTWYHQSLVKHGEAMLNVAHDSFDGALSAIPIAYKIPGIHWLIAKKDGYARSAEMAAGLIPPADYGPSNVHGYYNILSLAKNFEALNEREVIVHFTALEMSDTPHAPAFSKAKTLVKWIGEGAHKLNIKVKGENALAYGVHTALGWQNINHALTNNQYLGLTVLRIGDVADQSKIGFEEYKKLTK